MQLSARTWLEITGVAALGVYAWLWHTRQVIPEKKIDTNTIEAGDSELRGAIVGGTTTVDSKGNVTNYGGTMHFTATARFTRSTTAAEVSGPEIPGSAFKPDPWRGFVYVGVVAPEFPSLEFGIGFRAWTWWRFHFGFLIGYETMSYNDYRMRELKAAALVGL